MREIAIGLGFLLTISGARAEAPGSGVCGSVEAYVRTRQVDDLPGCDKSSGRDPWEQLVFDARSAVGRAQRQVDAESAEGLDKVLAQAESLVGQLQRHPGRKSDVVDAYREAMQRLRQRAAMLPELDEVRSCQAHGQAALRTARERSHPMVSASDLPIAKAALQRGEGCLLTLRKLTGKHGGAARVELSPGTTAALEEIADGLEATQRELLMWHAEVQQEFTASRARWLRVLYGDRVKLFNDHPDELPEYDGKARGPLPASVAPRWYYKGPDGQTETYRFQRNRLVGKTVSDMRRS